MPSSSSTVSATPSRRDRFVILGCIAVVVALAWAYLFYLDRQMADSMAYDAEMAAMGMMDEPWTLTDVMFTFAMWTVMMVGMMAGTAAPVLLLFAASRAKRPGPGARLAVLAFGLGYLLVWVGFSGCFTRRRCCHP